MDSHNEPLTEDPAPSQTENEAESGYDTIGTTISLRPTRTTRNSSAPIVIQKEADGSYADPGKILSAARKARKTRERQSNVDAIINDEPSMGSPILPKDKMAIMEELATEDLDDNTTLLNNRQEIHANRMNEVKQFHQLHLLIQLQLEILETRKASLRIQFSSIQKLPPNCPMFLTLNQSTWP